MNPKSDKDINTPLFHTPKIIRVSKSWIWPTRIIFWLIAGYFLNESYSGYIEETIFVHRDYLSLTEEPFMYWFAVIGYLVATVGSFWQSFRVKVKT